MENLKLRQIAHALPSYLKEIPEGTKITSGQFVKKGGLDPKDLSKADLLEFHEVFFVAANVRRITLDPPEHASKSEELPWNLEFTVRRDNQ